MLSRTPNRNTSKQIPQTEKVIEVEMVHVSSIWPLSCGHFLQATPYIIKYNTIMHILNFHFTFCCLLAMIYTQKNIHNNLLNIGIEANESSIYDLQWPFSWYNLSMFPFELSLWLTYTVCFYHIQALSNQKYREMQELFKDVGLMTGDVTINPSASCIVMTTEVCAY